VVIAIQLEDVRVAIGVGFCATCHQKHCPRNSPVGEGDRLYFIWDQKSASKLHQVISF